MGALSAFKYRDIRVEKNVFSRSVSGISRSDECVAGSETIFCSFTYILYVGNPTPRYTLITPRKYTPHPGSTSKYICNEA